MGSAYRQQCGGFTSFENPAILPPQRHPQWRTARVPFHHLSSFGQCATNIVPLPAGLSGSPGASAGSRLPDCLRRKIDFRALNIHAAGMDHHKWTPTRRLILLSLCKTISPCTLNPARRLFSVPDRLSPPAPDCLCQADMVFGGFMVLFTFNRHFRSFATTRDSSCPMLTVRSCWPAYPCCSAQRLAYFSVRAVNFFLVRRVLEPQFIKAASL